MNDCALHASIGLNITKYSKLNLSIHACEAQSFIQ